MPRPWPQFAWLVLAALPATPLAGATVIDRIAVIVDKHIVKTSDIDRDLRTTEFLNHQPLDLSPDARRKSAERLIDQSVIREAIEKGAYTSAAPSDVDAMLKQLVDSRFGGMEGGMDGGMARFREELTRYGLTEDKLRLELQWQLDVLKFIDQRFRPGVMVSDDEVRSYYNQHLAELQRQFPQAKTYEAMEPRIRASLEGERLNQNFDQWLAEARKRDHIE